MGYVKGGSKPSLIAGVGLGASYGVAGKLIPGNPYTVVSSTVVLTSARILVAREQGLWL